MENLAGGKRTAPHKTKPPMPKKASHESKGDIACRMFNVSRPTGTLMVKDESAVIDIQKQISKMTGTAVDRIRIVTSKPFDFKPKETIEVLMEPTSDDEVLFFHV